MPYVNVRITKGVTREQKAQLVRQITDTLVRVLAKKPEHTHIVIDEVDEDNYRPLVGESRHSSKEFICSVRPSLNDRFRLRAALQKSVRPAS